jgi:hypothetical protein
VFAAIALSLVWAGPASSQPYSVLAVDCTPFVSPGFTSFGPDNTIGMALQFVDAGNVLFNVTEVTPAAFRGMGAAALASFDLLAINNRSDRIDCGSGLGLGTNWHSVVGVNNGGRVVLSSHDAPRFHLIVGPGSTVMSGSCLNCEPFGTFNLVRDAATWAAKGCQTGLLIFNDSWAFDPGSAMGWGNPELNLPAAWNITDLLEPSGISDGGYTDILPAFTAHPIYANVTDARLASNSISSFAANIGDLSFHSSFATHNATIFTVTEQMVNSGVVDVGGFGCCSGIAGSTPDGTPITLIRNDDCSTQSEDRTWGSVKSIYR